MVVCSSNSLPNPSRSSRWTNTERGEDWGYQNLDSQTIHPRTANDASPYTNPNSRFTRAEWDQLGSYKDSRYKPVNEYLRTGSISRDDTGFYAKNVDTWIADIDSAIEKSVIKDDVTAWRGMDADLFKNMSPGDVFMDPAYTSTSLRSSIFKDFARTGHVEVRIPKGYQGIYMEAFDPAQQLKEMELLLKRGTRFRIISITERGPVGRDVVVEVIP